MPTGSAQTFSDVNVKREKIADVCRCVCTRPLLGAGVLIWVYVGREWLQKEGEVQHSQIHCIEFGKTSLVIAHFDIVIKRLIVCWGLIRLRQLKGDFAPSV